MGNAYVNGFSIDTDTGRIVMEDSPGVYEWMGLPFDKDNISAGEIGGAIVSVNVRAAVDANNEIVCQDVSKNPFDGNIVVSGGIPHKPDGTVLIDTVSDIKYYYQQLPYVANGALAVMPMGPEPVQPTAPTALTKTGLTQADLGTFTFKPASIESGTIKKYVGKDSLGKTADLTTTGTDPLTFTWQFAKPAQNYTLQVAAVSDLGVTGPYSTALPVTTFSDQADITSAASDIPAQITVNWKAPAANGNATITAWKVKIAGPGAADFVEYDVNGTIFTLTRSDLAAKFWGACKVWVQGTTTAGLGALDPQKPFLVNIQPIVKPGAVNITKLEAISDTSVRVTITKPATGSDPINYKCGIIQKDPAKAWTEDVAMTFNGTVGTGVIEGMTPATINTIGCYGVNAAGQGDNSGTTMDITMPDYSVPVAPELDNVYVASTSAVLAFTYTDPRQSGRTLEPLFYTGYAKDSGGKVTKREVYDPDQDLVIYGLTTGVVYDFWVTATSISEKEGPASNSMKATTKTVIAAPVVKSIVAGDASATATFDPVTPADPWTIAHYSFLAVNLDNPDAPEVSGHCVSGTPFPLENDINWNVSICAVCNPGLVPGDFSAPVKVSPEKKVVPFKPTITQAYANPDGTIKVDWVKGSAQSGASQSGMTVTKWTIQFQCMADSSKSFIDYVDPPEQTFTSHAVDAGEWKVLVNGKNDVGDGPVSFPAYVTYTPTKEDPILGGQIFRGYNGDPYDYCLFYSNATTGYEAIRTSVGKDMTFEVLLVGPGGAGKGQTLTMGQGGAGGGGQLVYDTLPPTGGLTSIFVTVPAGGKTGGDDPANATVKEVSKTITAIAGKTATSKADAEGYPKQKVEDSWSKLNMFTWLLPGSDYVGGSAQTGEQNYPDATFCGEGGAGTKQSKGGNAQPSYCAIRWKKLA